MTQFHYQNKSQSSGIYLIFNVHNWKIYVGSCANFKKRWYQHVQALKNNKHSNKHLQASWNKWGPDAFEFHVLEVVEGSKERRLEREEHWIGVHWDHSYNGTRHALSREGLKSKDPEETRKKMSSTMKQLYLAGKGSGYFVPGQSPHNKGKKLSQETRRKLSDATKKAWKDGKLHKDQHAHHTRSPETRKKQSETMKKLIQRGKGSGFFKKGHVPWNKGK